ncbi:hypothetical protein [Buttiauxella sp. S04-F03]|uniref:hypothetical protein n=1 Tax=Buttiauxella sp. S04-F03 TaxID=2904525 RepID=UPI001E4F5277|nr:hypothetical protein [Buttiauxella sp. S04-F03]MCE0813560.1 hypothetical protein [Buttiauxella sp. S04-F03]
MLGSINEPKDIVVYYHLYVRKAYHQRSYAVPSYDGYQGNLKPVPLLEIELCHMHPNGKGGENTAINIFIGPKCINRRNNDSIPFQDNGFAGVRSTNERIPLDGSLYDTLIEHYGPQVVADALGDIDPAKRFYGNILRHISFSGMDKELPLFTLLHEELWRLEHRDIAECLSNIKSMFSYYPLYLELLAITGFYAVLSGDPDRIMLRICRLFSWFFDVRSHRRFTSRAHNQYLKVMYRFMRKYLRRYFEVEIENLQDVVAFYNSLYSQAIVGIGQATDEVICYSYSMGRTRTVSTFFYTPRVVTDPEELLRLMGAELDFN